MRSTERSVQARTSASDRRAGRSSKHCPSAGQSLAEYLIVLSLVSMALAVGPNSPLEQLFDALGDRYQRFTAEVSKP